MGNPSGNIQVKKEKLPGSWLEVRRTRKFFRTTAKLLAKFYGLSFRMYDDISKLPADKQSSLRFVCREVTAFDDDPFEYGDYLKRTANNFVSYVSFTRKTPQKVIDAMESQPELSIVPHDLFSEEMTANIVLLRSNIPHGGRYNYHLLFMGDKGERKRERMLIYDVTLSDDRELVLFMLMSQIMKSAKMIESATEYSDSFGRAIFTSTMHHLVSAEFNREEKDALEQDVLVIAILDNLSSMAKSMEVDAHFVMSDFLMTMQARKIIACASAGALDKWISRTFSNMGSRIYHSDTETLAEIFKVTNSLAKMWESESVREIGRAVDGCHNVDTLSKKLRALGIDIEISTVMEGVPPEDVFA